MSHLKLRFFSFPDPPLAVCQLQLTPPLQTDKTDRGFGLGRPMYPQRAVDTALLSDRAPRLSASYLRSQSSRYLHHSHGARLMSPKLPSNRPICGPNLADFTRNAQLSKIIYNASARLAIWPRLCSLLFCSRSSQHYKRTFFALRTRKL